MTPATKQLISDWIQVVANGAAALGLVLAAWQFRASTKAEHIQNSLNVLSEGRQLEEQYRAGTAQARDIVTFYYRVYIARDEFDADVIRPLERSLCSQVIGDKRVDKYWKEVMAQEEKGYYRRDFALYIDDITNGRKSCE
jgi:hypothetical protein